jgi:phosphopantetheinyl transferase
LPYRLPSIFSLPEAALLRSLPETRRHDEFFTFWTLKEAYKSAEAYTKCKGQGLTISLNHLDVSAALEESAPRYFSRWSLQKLAVPPGYAAAIAFEGYACQLQCFYYSDTDIVDILWMLKDR